MKQDQKSYSNQNEELKQLYLLRLARNAAKEKPEQPDNLLPFSKSIDVMKEGSEKRVRTGNEIYLNSVFYDTRSKEEKTNNIMLPCLLHPDVDAYPLKPMSKDIQAIMITNYGFQMEVFDPIARSKVPFFVVNRMGNQPQGKIIKEYEGYKSMTVISPPKRNNGYGVFHTKLWLVKFKTFLRVVVSTSNNHVLDWSIWQNAYWYHDCPLVEKQLSKKEDPKENEQVKKSEVGKLKQFPYESDFTDTLKWIIAQMQPSGYDILKEMGVSLDQYSFKDVKAILIPSLVGRFKGNYLEKIGQGKIKKIMKEYAPQLKNPTMTVNCTSLGRLDQKYVRETYTSFCPSSGLFSLNRFKLVYPTDKYIKQRTCGESQVLFLKAEQYAKSQIKKQIFYRYEPSAFNGVEGGIPHLKTIIIQQENNPKVVLYVGSHNFTQAAWGSMEKNGSQISCNNEELGLLFLDYSEEELLRWLPYQYPPQRYDQNDKPFIQ